jgi:hypothetical protein
MHSKDAFLTFLDVLGGGILYENAPVSWESSRHKAKGTPN